MISETEPMDDANASMNLHPVPVLPMLMHSRGAEGNFPSLGETVTAPSEIWILAPRDSSPRIMCVMSSPSSPTCSIRRAPFPWHPRAIHLMRWLFEAGRTHCVPDANLQGGTSITMFSRGGID